MYRILTRFCVEDGRSEAEKKEGRGSEARQVVGRAADSEHLGALSRPPVTQG